jgi:hypothetical protein
MSKLVANEQCWVGFVTTMADPNAPSAATDISGAEDLTCLLVSLNASAQGNTVPVPVLCSLFEQSVPGTSSANFTADFYRDDEADDAWTSLPSGTKGYFLIGRFGLSGSTADGKPQPDAGDVIEVWPVQVTSRSAGPLASNQVQTFTMVGSVPDEPNEEATVVA